MHEKDRRTYMWDDFPSQIQFFLEPNSVWAPKQKYWQKCVMLCRVAYKYCTSIELINLFSKILKVQFFLHSPGLINNNIMFVLQ